jgi:hypothetical protein
MCDIILLAAYVTEAEIVFPPKPIKTIREAKKAAAMRLGKFFGQALIIYV